MEDAIGSKWDYVYGKCPFIGMRILPKVYGYLKQNQTHEPSSDAYFPLSQHIGRLKLWAD